MSLRPRPSLSAYRKPPFARGQLHLAAFVPAMSGREADISRPMRAVAIYEYATLIRLGLRWRPRTSYCRVRHVRERALDRALLDNERYYLPSDLPPPSTYPRSTRGAPLCARRAQGGISVALSDAVSKDR